MPSPITEGAPAARLKFLDAALYAIVMNVGLRWIAVAAAVGVKLDPTKGTIAFSTWSCLQRAGPGVVVSIDTGERVYYYGDSGTLDLNATSTANAGGLGVIWNVEPGARRLEAKLDGVGTRVATYLVQVVADSLTEAVLDPTPEGN